ncbi:DUF7718 family protein [Candidatus Halobonum tyrrellensis]|uniref:DUF7718 domain-containing protein n=1 Tax=Candidatus Halobonum tyrrellensis G22 TaxID=1324957 RepID=V4GSE2_9EURY|nr:hypothetical protein [Candidatus Halobonum tyrrellensis]ESP88011.1 hypothetical protein K933_11151 [Candidatus Halobonum tyrrellensis G22]
MGESTFEYRLGRYAGHEYFLTASARPGFDDPAEFAVVVHYNDVETSESVQVVRIDTAHGFVHIDRLYRRDQPKDELDLGFWDAVEYAEEHWRTYAEGHEDGVGG